MRSLSQDVSTLGARPDVHPACGAELLRVVGAEYFPRLAGRGWMGWRFAQGKLWSPEGHGFSAGDIRALPYVHALAAEYIRENRYHGKLRAGSSG